MSNLCYSTDDNTNALIERNNRCKNEGDRRTNDQKKDAELKAQSNSGRNLRLYKVRSGRAL